MTIADADKVSLYKDLTAIINELKSMYEHVKGYKIPIMRVEGERRYLPEVFKLINTQGTPLTKYQIFGATWNEFNISFTNPSIV